MARAAALPGLAHGDLLQHAHDVLGVHMAEGVPVHGRRDADVLYVHRSVRAIGADGGDDRLPVIGVHLDSPFDFRFLA